MPSPPRSTWHCESGTPWSAGRLPGILRGNRHDGYTFHVRLPQDFTSNFKPCERAAVLHAVDCMPGAFHALPDLDGKVCRVRRRSERVVDPTQVLCLLPRVMNRYDEIPSPNSDKPRRVQDPGRFRPLEATVSPANLLRP